MSSPPRQHAVVFYSRDDHTHALASQIADGLDADLFRIATDRYGDQPFSYLLAGFDSLVGRLPAIKPLRDMAGYVTVSLGTPVWIGNPATPLRAYLAQDPTLPGTVGLFTTSGGDGPQAKARKVVEDILGYKVDAAVNVPNGTDTGEIRSRVAGYCESLLAGLGKPP
ncbi:hypothetical protein ILP92_13090 [Maribius pontilimi]|uniref:Flavodoxin n=1 Tax=Palleronia pontilimi TaxID=1964209 RepID=A0A934IDK6_9RHOB|nr:hypothetical protein [Palleronia pontilimi]MBJ3763686.1 hypothetical protein [Palleronia pontilimi]